MPEQSDAVTVHKINRIERGLKAPRTAALAGIAFAVLYGACLIILTLSVRHYTVGGSPDTS